MPTMALYLSFDKNQITQSPTDPSNEEMVQLADVKETGASNSIKALKGTLDNEEMDDLMTEAFEKKQKKVSV